MDISYSFLQHYWWFIVSLLGSFLVFLFFVQGGQTFYRILAKNDLERTLLVNVTGRKWKFTFTTLVTFGGALFASFPLFYSTSFGGAFAIWVLTLFCFVIQAVAYEFRSKPSNILGTAAYDIFLYVNGIFGPFLFGAIVGTLFTGSDFVVSKNALSNIHQPVISYWGNHFYGLEILLDYRNILFGLTICLLSRVLGLVFYIKSINHDSIIKRAVKHLWINSTLFVVLFILLALTLLTSSGYAVDIAGTVYIYRFKYLTNFIEMPPVMILFIIGVLSLLYGIGNTLFIRSKYAFWLTGIGTVLTVLSLLLNVGFNGTSYYPSLTDLQSSLTIFNSSASKFTLSVMACVSLVIPIVYAYISYVWRAMDRKQMTINEFKSDSDSFNETY